MSLSCGLKASCETPPSWAGAKYTRTDTYIANSLVGVNACACCLLGAQIPLFDDASVGTCHQHVGVKLIDLHLADGAVQGFKVVDLLHMGVWA